MVHSFLLIGQSNMAGRGFLKDVPLLFDNQIKMLVNGRWQTMWEPINHDRPTAGVGLAASFAATWRLKHEGEEIGLIPCADGGTSLDDWAVGEVLFEHAVFQAKLAQRISTVAGILWHQGENDCSLEQSSRYQEKFSLIVEAFRRELNTPDIPLIIGGLGDFLSRGRYGAYFTGYPAVNEALQQFASTTPNCYFVTAAGLTANPDGLHFDAVSQRIFGIRYFEGFHQQKHILAQLPDEKGIVDSISNRPLSKAEKAALLEIRFANGELALVDLEMQLQNL
ncbi:sialate O-acetylesterase [Hymenobacter bucti]|uniref:Sialate O-acetylesterase n=1 Tax=Hymenobacter bucti TaxID=1844114 RepID=A0ABW4QZS5_9BACT